MGDLDLTSAVDVAETIDPAPVEALLQALIKAVRAAQLYLPNNPVFQQALANLREAYRPVWALATEIELTVRETTLLLGPHVVLDQSQKSDSFAWLLYKDGIRSITLRAGAEDEETLRLVSVLKRGRNLPADADDDLLTLLWEQDFQYIQYRFVELFTEEARPLEEGVAPAAPGEETAVQSQDVTEEVARPEGLVRLDDFDSTLYFLDDKDIAYLKNEVEREYRQDLRGNVLAILFDIFELQTFSTVRAEIVSIIENFIPYLLGAGDFRAVSYVLRELRTVVERARELQPEQREALEALPARLSEPEAVAQLLQSLDEASMHPSEEELSGLFRELRPEALESVLAWLPRLTNARVKELLQQAVQRLATQNPEELAKALGSEDDAVVRETVKLAQLLKLPPVVPALGGLLVANRRAAIKVAVIECLAAIGTPSAMQQLERAVSDSQRDVRVAAVKVLAQRRHRAALARVEAIVMGRELKDADLTEKMAFFEAFGVLVGANGISKLVPLLAPGGFMRRGHDSATRACAAMALGKIGTPEARSALQAIAADKDPLVRNAVNRALKKEP